jgi:hypothetical protein
MVQATRVTLKLKRTRLSSRSHVPMMLEFGDRHMFIGGFDLVVNIIIHRTQAYTIYLGTWRGIIY